MALVSEVIAQVRDLLADTLEPYRHENAKLIRYLNDACRDGYSIRPDLFYGYIPAAVPITTQDQDGNPITFNVTRTFSELQVPEFEEDDIANGTEFPLNAMFIPPFVQYTVSMAEFEDDEYAADGRAAVFHKTFAQKLRGSPR